MLDLVASMPGKVGPATATWPYGEPQNVSAPSAGDGTPWRADLGKDMIGFLHAIADAQSVAPSGTPDTPVSSQIYDALLDTIQQFPQFDEFIVNNKMSLSGALELPLEEDITGLTGTNNDVALTNQNTEANFRVVATDALVWTGIVAPDTTVDDRLIILKRDGGTSFTLRHENAGSAAANRLSLVGGNDVELADGEFAALLYNPTIIRWELIWRSSVEVTIPGGSINQSALDTSSGSVTSSTTSFAIFTLPGGQYGFYPQVRATVGSGGLVGANIIANNTPGSSLGTSFATRIMLVGDSSPTENISAQQRYINASAPYDLGDGHVPLFVFVMIKDGDIAGAYVADAPPWAYNGPTDIAGVVMVTEEDIEEIIPAPISSRLTRDEKGRLQKVFSAASTETQTIHRKLRRTQRMRKNIILPHTLRDVVEGRITAAQLADQQAAVEWVPIDTAFKNSDMPLIPHPFQGSDMDQVILLDPTGTAKLREMHDAGVDVGELLTRGYIEIGDAIPSANTPDGVVAHRFRFKNT